MHTVPKNDGEERSEQLNSARFEISASLETVEMMGCGMRLVFIGERFCV